VRRYAQQQGYSFPITLDHAPLAAVLASRNMIPLTTTVNRQGLLHEVIPGEMFEEDVLGLIKLGERRSPHEDTPHRGPAWWPVPGPAGWAQTAPPAAPASVPRGRSGAGRQADPGTPLRGLPRQEGGRRRHGGLPPGRPHQQPAALLTMVERCSNELNLGLFPEDVAAVAAVLQRDHYRFPAQPASGPELPGPAMNKRPPVPLCWPSTPAEGEESDQVFDSAAELFRLLATPIRLKIISALCGQEKNVSQLLGEIDTTQPNMSQHLATLYRAGVLARRRDATQIYYRIGSERAATLCRAVCMQIAVEIDGDVDMPPQRAPGAAGGRPSELQERAGRLSEAAGRLSRPRQPAAGGHQATRFVVGLRFLVEELARKGQPGLRFAPGGHQAGHGSGRQQFGVLLQQGHHAVAAAASAASAVTQAWALAGSTGPAHSSRPPRARRLRVPAAGRPARRVRPPSARAGPPPGAGTVARCCSASCHAGPGLGDGIALGHQAVVGAQRPEHQHGGQDQDADLASAQAHGVPSGRAQCAPRPGPAPPISAR
jgi:DNA-binding transcriptional ArsR family regulator